MSDRVAERSSEGGAGDEGAQVDSNTLDAHLCNWARWMNSREAPAGLPETACGGILGYRTEDRDSFAAWERMDAWLAEHTDAAINALVPAELAAIYREYGVTVVWRFPRQNYEDTLVRARANVRALLLRRGVVVT